MDIVTDLKNIPAAAQNCVIAIGNFDGVHKGHQALLHRTKALAREKNATCAVLTFEPHPRALFRPDDPPFRITPAPVKHRRFAIEGVDHVFSLPFDWDFASQSPDAFIQSVLKDGIQPRHIIVGDDFRFGQLRAGTPETIKEAGFAITVLDKIDSGKKAVSSSRVRSALRHAKLQEAWGLLGWRWEIQGEIVKGDQRGRELGYPTANVPLKDTLHPSYGIYATWAHIEDYDPPGLWRPSVTNIGIRPMFEVKVGQVETFIFDFDDDIYGKTLRVMPVEKLRGEARFDSLEALVTQMDKDSAQARAILEADHPRTPNDKNRDV